MGEVLKFTGATKGHVPIADVLDHAGEACEDLLILGEEKDGTLYFAASTGDKGTLLLWIETFKFALLSGDYDAPGE